MTAGRFDRWSAGEYAILRPTGIKFPCTRYIAVRAANGLGAPGDQPLRRTNTGWKVMEVNRYAE